VEPSLHGGRGPRKRARSGRRQRLERILSVGRKVHGTVGIDSGPAAAVLQDGPQGFDCEGLGDKSVHPGRFAALPIGLKGASADGDNQRPIAAARPSRTPSKRVHVRAGTCRLTNSSMSQFVSRLPS